MALVSITEAARLARRGRASLYRDIEKGRLSKTLGASGETGIETSELVRVYGKIHLDETSQMSHKNSEANGIDEFETLTDTWDASKSLQKVSHETLGDSYELAILQEKLKSAERHIALLEKIAALEKTVRQDTTAALRAQLADKDAVLKVLEGQILRLTYETPVGPVEPVRPTEAVEKVKEKSLWRRLFNS